MDENDIFDENNNTALIPEQDIPDDDFKYSTVAIIFKILNVLYVIVFGVALTLNYTRTIFSDGKYLIQIIIGMIFLFSFIFSQLFWQKTNKEIWMWISVIFGIILAPVLLWVLGII